MCLIKAKPLILFLALVGQFSFFACNYTKKKSKESTQTESIEKNEHSKDLIFSADSAYSFIAKQLSFGPRVPNTPSHLLCGRWLEEKLSLFGAEVMLQEDIVDTHRGGTTPIKNIIASYNKEKKDRIILLAHWDTRPTADKDPNPSLQKKPILGADDGASGVAVLLEIARLMQLTKSTLPIDIILVDAEDMGESQVEESWCLGSTYWSKNPHQGNYQAKCGILLDMVGSKNAKFMWEYFSKRYASAVLSQVWNKASELGYGAYFVNADGAALTDDHIPLIKNRAVPVIDIVNYDTQRENGFGDHWHTHSDDLPIIDKEVLMAVGNTLWYSLEEL